MKIRIENLPLNMAADDLKELFSRFGDVSSAEVSVQANNAVFSLTGVVDMPRFRGAQSLNEVCGFKFESNTLRVKNAKDLLNIGSKPLSTVVVSLTPVVDP